MQAIYDLNKELDHLKLIATIPRLYLSNYFINLRNEIDLIFAPKSIVNNSDALCFKKTWKEIIEAVDTFESKLDVKRFTLSQTVIDETNQQITHIQTKLTETHIQDSIDKEKHKLERILLKNKTILILDKSNCLWDDLFNENELAKLVIVTDEYINNKEINLIKKKYILILNKNKKSFKKFNFLKEN